MFTMMVLAHLLGDFAFQFNALARWKARSVWGVVAHGGIVTATALACAMVVDPLWWPYALLIGVLHTLIDVVRARMIHATDPAMELALLLGDQGLHLAVIAGIVRLSGAGRVMASLAYRLPISAPQAMAFAIGYLLLMQPAWVLLRFVVRGVWGADAAPHLGAGEKYGPMLERVFIATLVLTGHIYLVPMVLLPRRLTTVYWQSNGLGVMVRLTSHWAETLLSVMLAMGMGLALRVITVG